MSHKISEPRWLPDYLEKSEILSTLVGLLRQGGTDKEIAHKLRTSEAVVYSCRMQYNLYRPEECQYCGRMGSPCMNDRCLTNWGKKFGWV